MNKPSYLFNSSSLADYILVPIYMILLFRYDDDTCKTLLMTIGCGFVLWTFIEYWMHRVLLHWILKRDHAYHHAHPEDAIGNPPWVTFLIVVVFWWIAWFVSGKDLASSLTIGTLLGYWVYSLVHEKLHHINPYESGFIMRQLHAHHENHHRFARTNYGVITSMWDHIFLTKI